ERIQARLSALWDYPKFGVPRREGDHYFYWENPGLLNQPVLFALPARPRDELADTVPVAVLDPNALSPDGTAAVSGTSFTPDGRLLAYGLSVAGSDWQDIHVRTLDGGTSDGNASGAGDLPDVIRWC